MTSSRRPAAALLIALFAGTACGPAPSPSPSPAGGTPAPAPASTAPASDLPFAPASWPASGTACAASGDTARIGRIEAPDARTVVFTLCAPDGAFLARLAHPAMGIVDAADLARVAADPASARDLAGHGSYRIARWGASNVELARVGAVAAAATAPTIILRWAPDPAARTADLVAAAVDGIDAPNAAGLSTAATTPSLDVVDRPLLATAVLGFGRGAAFADARVRRAVAMGVDTDALAQSAFPPGSTAADHLVPCDVPGACGAARFRGFNGPAATASLQGLAFNFDASYTITIPDAPIPGLPDPAGVAAALRDQLAAGIGLTATVVSMPVEAFRAAVDGGTVTGLYLDGVAAAVADPTAFNGPLFLAHPASLAARLAAGATAALIAGAQDPVAGTRAAAFTNADTVLRDAVPVAPLVHPGSAAIFQADVEGAAVSPLGADPLGAMTAGDRGQVVFEQAAAPGGGWCGPQASMDAYRLCALVTDGLYGTAPGSLAPTPRIASACTPNDDATVWTCRLRSARTADGLVLDAADVVATFRAMADPADPAHAALGDGAWAAWDEVFGAVSGWVAQPRATAAPSASASPAGRASPEASPSQGPSGAPSPRPSSSG